MKIYEILDKKKNGKILSAEEIDFVVKNYLNNEIKDYQMSALLMSICINGMNFEETVDLTKSMINSGDIVDLKNIRGIKVDKHSTGGVGDKTSLVVLPLMASFGLKISKMSGKGLGHTGGTLDKLLSIPGFKINLSTDEMIRIVNDIGFVITGQTNNLVPADKKLYALRDVTATVDNISLISSSIMSKKIASGADYILLDVKVGEGAFLKTLPQAVELSEYMVEIGKRFNKKVMTVLSNMNQPLGNNIGNSLEVIEAVNTLKNAGPEDFSKLCVILNAFMLKLTGIVDSVDAGIVKTKKMLNSDIPYNLFKKFISAQSGNIDYIDNTKKFTVSKNIISIKSHVNGYISSINAKTIGMCSLWAGAGRETKESEIDYSAGVIINKKIGDYIEKDEIIGEIHTNKDGMDMELSNIFLKAYSFSDVKSVRENIVLGYVDDNGYKKIDVMEY